MFVIFRQCSLCVRITFPNSNLLYFQLFILIVSKFVKGYIYLAKTIKNILGYSELPNFWLNCLISDRLEFVLGYRMKLRTPKKTSSNVQERDIDRET